MSLSTKVSLQILTRDCINGTSVDRNDAVAFLKPAIYVPDVTMSIVGFHPHECILTGVELFLSEHLVIIHMESIDRVDLNIVYDCHHVLLFVAVHVCII